MHPASSPGPSLAALDRTWIAEAALARCRREAEGALPRERLRPLRSDEIGRLRNQGNWARAWSDILVAEDFNPDNVVANRFEGPAWLGRFDGAAGGDRAQGVFHSALANCAIASGARVADCRRVERAFIGEGARVENVGWLGMRGEESPFGNGLELFREELFSRRARAAAETPLDWIAWVSGPEASLAPGAAEEMNAAVDAYAATLKSDRCFVAPGARVIGASAIENCFIGPHAAIEAAGTLRDSTIWGAEGEPAVVRDAAELRTAQIGPACVVEAGAYVQDSILVEHVHVGHHAIVKGSAVGPNSRLAGGETNDCLLGPFTMSIHQGLILGAWWPEGKGNIAYGSNVGSNHTGKAPDQEVWPGEGLFFGLGCSVKFPANFREAPYTIIAAGVSCMPQKVSFPFSLIAAPSSARQGISPALNEIFPGWGLAQNAYGLERQDRNQFARNRARRTKFPLGALRPELIDAMLAAANRLEAGAGSKRETHLESDIAGLGKNFLAEQARAEGVAAYRWGAKACAARCVLMALDRAVAPSAPPEGPAPAPWSAPLGKWAASILGVSGGRSAVEEALRAHGSWAAAVLESKSRDDRRGQAVIPDYGARHVSAARDPVALAVAADQERFKTRKVLMRALWDSVGA